MSSNAPYIHLYSSHFSCAGWAHPVLGAPGVPGGILTWGIRFCAPKYPQEPQHAPKRRFEKNCLAAAPPPPPPMTSPPAMPHPCLSRPSHLPSPTIPHPWMCQWQLRAILHPSMAQQQLLRWRRGGGGGAARLPAASPAGMPHPCLSRTSHLPSTTITHPWKCQWQLRAILHPSMAQQQLLRWRRGGGGGAARPPAASPAGILRPPPTCMLPTNPASQAGIHITTEPQTRWHQHSSSHQLWAACGAAWVAAAS